jgi:hypothetical protein
MRPTDLQQVVQQIWYRLQVDHNKLNNDFFCVGVMYSGEYDACDVSLRPRLHYTELHQSDTISVPDWALVYTTPL